MNRELHISYAQAFVSFLFRTPGLDAGKIRSVYLFGSVARGDFDESSDVDVFLDTGKDEKDILKFSGIALKNFYRSEECRKFRLLGIANRISVKCGNVRRWKLLGSVKSEGIVLYSASTSPFFRKYFLLEIKTIKNVARRNRIVRRLSGRKETKRKEIGLVEQIGGEILDSRHYIIPAEKIVAVTPVLSRENALFEIREIWM